MIPTHRRPCELRNAVESALAQTWPEIEVVVVSDGPDADSRAATSGIDPRVRYLELAQRSGPAAARNEGVMRSRGEWLCFLDDDDTMLPGRVEAQMKLADSSAPTRMVSCRMMYRYDGREEVWPARPIAADEDVAEYILRRPSLLGRPGVVAIQSLLVHRSVVEQIPFSDHADHEDWAWLLQAWHVLGARVVFAWEPLVVYNIVTSEVSRSRRVNWADSLAWAMQHRRWISDRAFCSFLASKVALKAKRAGDWNGLCEIAKEIMRSRPGLVDVAFFAGIAITPATLLHSAWKRSLRSGVNTTAGAEMASTPAG